ncbi:putative lipid II flippase FtsW [Domibacillus epiphyticus]|uniref:Putative lipid II flippase FtsW n=2 Tax=Domibacillus epiphyticus TaxID=1714355 RepID=A0A1V2ACQ4_9BACI|nr:putative lipid II flippase FtsW [Domibacillus epiphyticus]
MLVLVLTGTGLFMVASAGEVWGQFNYENPFYFVERQAFFAAAGLVVMAVISYVDYRIWRNLSSVLLVLAFLLLVAVLIPGIGMVRNGSQSWIGFGSLSFQPSELMKIVLIFYLSALLAERKKVIHLFWKGLFKPLLVLGIAFALIMMQPDLGTAAVMGGTAFLLLFVAGAPIRFFVLTGVSAIGGLALLIISAPYRMKRITAYLDPWSDPLGSGFQIIQSLYAVGPGGLFGYGYGESRQKYYYLPEPQTDFIFAIWAEETGFIGAVFIMILFFLLIWRGIHIASRIEDAFGVLLVCGITAMISLQSFINLGVVTGLLPVTGVTLPFLSYGGSSLTMTLASAGIVLSVSRSTV